MARALLLGILLCAACEQQPPAGLRAAPTRLSLTGLYADVESRRLSEGVLRLEPRFPLWSDGAEKERFLLLPEGASIDTSDMDHWRYPVGTRAWKSFRLGGELVETRYLEKQREPDDGGWLRLAYAWEPDGRDAVAAPLGVMGVRGTSYEIPSEAQCAQCHYRGEKPIIGLSALQLSRGPDGGESESMRRLRDAGVLSAPPSRVYSPPGDGDVQAALGYLHANCSHCHDTASAGAPYVKVFMELHVTDERPEDTAAYRSLVGRAINHPLRDPSLTGLVVPGSPEASLVPYRMARRDALQMPPVGTHAVDEEGVATVGRWIEGLEQP